MPSKGLSRVFSSTTVRGSILQHSVFFLVQLSHPYMSTGKTTVLTIWTFVVKLMSLLFNTLSRFVIAFLSRSKCLLLSRLQSPSTKILEPHFFPPSVCHEVMVLETMISVFRMLSFKPAFSFSSFTFLRSIPRSERHPGVGNGSAFWFSCLENSMDREIWRAAVQGGCRVVHD